MCFITTKSTSDPIPTVSTIILRIDKGSPDVWDLFMSLLYEERDTPRLLTETGRLESLGLLQDSELELFK